MPTDANDGPSYSRSRFQFDAGLTPSPSDAPVDGRVELIVELIMELSDEKRAGLARRLASLEGPA
jgi:hypothetical protein